MWSAVCWHKSMFQRVPVTSVLDDSFGPNNNNNGVLFLFRSVFFAEDFLGVAVLFFSNSNSNSKRCGSLSLGTFFFIIKDIVVSNRNDLLADLERQQEQPQKEKHWTNTQPHLRNSCSSVARRRSIAPTLGTRRSLRKQALIKRGTRVDSHLRATDIPPKTKKKTGDYPPPLHCKKRERERDQRKVAHGRAWEDEDDAGLVRDLSVDAAFDSWRRFFASLHKNDGVWGVGWSFSCRKIFERYSCKDPRQRCRTEPVPALFSYPNLNVIKLYISWHHHRPWRLRGRSSYNPLPWGYFSSKWSVNRVFF